MLERLSRNGCAIAKPPPGIVGVSPKPVWKSSKPGSPFFTCSFTRFPENGRERHFSESTELHYHRYENRVRRVGKSRPEFGAVNDRVSGAYIELMLDNSPIRSATDNNVQSINRNRRQYDLENQRWIRLPVPWHPAPASRYRELFFCGSTMNSSRLSRVHTMPADRIAGEKQP